MHKLDLRLYLSACVCVLWLLMAVTAPVFAQDDVSFTAEVDRTTISTDDFLTLTLIVAGTFEQLGEPQLPFLSGLAVVGSSRSSQFSMVNGVVSARTVFTYRLQPSGPGTFTIDPVTILVNGSTYQTEPITIEVTQGAAPTPTRPAPPPDDGSGDTALAPGGLSGQDFYVEAAVDNATPVVGQQIIYYFRFYQAINLFNQPRVEWPSFSGFWTKDLSPNNVYDQIAAGRGYRVTEVRWALFPIAASGTGAVATDQVVIGPTTLTIPGDFFNRDLVLQTEPVVVDVQPLPDAMPPDFAGAVGQFQIEAWVEPVEARVNEPVTLFVRVSGTGNLTTLPDPTAGAETIIPDWRVYDPQTTTNVGQDGDTIRGDKLYERLLVPKVEGELSIPSFALTYFDPQANEYRQVETEPLVVPVAPGENLPPGIAPNGENKQDITVLGSDIRHIKAAPPSLAMHRTPLLAQPIYWLGWVMPLLAVVGAWTWDRRQRRLSNDVAYARAQRARRLARKRLAQARKQAQEDQDATYAAVASALNDYLGDKFNLPSAGLTRDAIRDTLTAQAIPDDLVERTLACLDRADSGRFAPIPASRPINPQDVARQTPAGVTIAVGDAGELVAAAETILTELEQAIRGT